MGMRERRTQLANWRMIHTVVIDRHRHRLGTRPFFSLLAGLLPKRWRWTLVQDLVVNDIVLACPDAASIAIASSFGVKKYRG